MPTHSLFGTITLNFRFLIHHDSHIYFSCVIHLAFQNNKNEVFLENTINEIYLSIILLFHSLTITEQLICLSSCLNIDVEYNQSIIPETCERDSDVELCKGQITAYYYDKTFPEYFYYTFGLTDEIKKTIDTNYVITRGLTTFIEYQFIINAKRGETIITADI
jgi:hypothetical protein